MSSENELIPSTTARGGEQSEAVVPFIESPSEGAVTKMARRNSTERSRSHRDRKRDAGGEVLSFVLGPSATAALAIVRAHTGRGKSKAVESTLIADALRLVGTPKAARAMAAQGLITDETLKAWTIVLDASISLHGSEPQSDPLATSPDA